MVDLAKAVEVIGVGATNAVQAVIDADARVQEAMETGDETNALAAIDAYNAADEAWDQFRVECATGGIALEEHQDRLRASLEEVIEVNADSPARALFDAAAASIEGPFKAYVAALDKERELTKEGSEDDPAEVDAEISAAEAGYRAALVAHSLSDDQWQAIHNYRSRLA